MPLQLNSIVLCLLNQEENCNYDKQRSAPCISTLPGLKFITLKKKVTKKKEYKKRLQLLAYDYTRISYKPVSNVFCVHLSWGEIIFVIAHVFS